MSYKTTFIFLPAVTGLLLLAGCGKTGSRDSASVREILECDSLPPTVKKLTKAVADGDSATFASLVSYPLKRPYPLHDINDSKEMERYYRVIVDDSLRTAITGASPDDWAQYGWRGWSIKKENYIWADDDVYSIPYVSASERRELDSLVNVEMNSVSPVLRRGWMPVACLRGNGNEFVYRIDSKRETNGKTIFRLCVYGEDSDLGGKPLDVMTGYRELEGSAGTATYFFRDKAGHSAVYAADVPDGSQPEIVFNNEETGEIEKEVKVKDTYWLDVLRERKR